MRHCFKHLVEDLAVRKLILVCLTGLFIESSAYGAFIYSLQDLGTLGGGTSSHGTAINDNGTGVGFSTVTGGATHAFRWTAGGGIQDLGNVGGGQSFAYDVNNAENVVGQTTVRAFRWTSGGGMVLIDSPNLGEARDLNETNEGVGSRIVGSEERAVRWTSADVPSAPFGSSDTQGVAINDNNEFVGPNFGGVSGYFSSGGPRTNLGLFLPTDLNNSREIVGAVGDMAALLDFDTNNTTLLGKLSLTDTYSQALGINENGTIVGISAGTGAFIYDSSMGGLGNLSSMLATGYSGWTILAAEDINNLGQIIGVGRFDGVDLAVILTTAVPEPGTLLLATLAIAGYLRDDATQPTPARMAGLYSRPILGRHGGRMNSPKLRP